MKNLFILVVVFAFISVSAFSQKNPSEVVKKEFTKKYATAQSVKWDSEEKNEWEAEFTMDGRKMSASFDNPAAVISTLNRDFQGYKKGPIEIFENPEMKGFELGLKKGETSIEVIFDKNGKVVKKTDLKEEDEKED